MSSGDAAAVPAASAPDATDARRRRVLLVTSLGLFVAFLDTTIVNVAFPSIRSSFADVSTNQLSWVLNGYNVVFAALLVPAGRLGDLLGRRRMFNGGLALFTVASILCAVAPSAEVLIAMRVLQAVGAAILIPTGLALLLPEYPLERRAAAIAIAGAAAAIAAAAGPTIGGLLVEVSDWRLVFLVNAPIALVTWLLGRGALVEARDPERGTVPDPLGVGLLTLGVAAIALGLVQSEQWRWGDERTLGALAAGALLLAAFVWRTRGHPRPAFELDLMRLFTLRTANFAVLLFAAGFYAKILCDVLFLTSVWRHSVLEAGLTITPGPLITAATAGAAGRLADRYGVRAATVPGGVIYAAGCLWFVTQPGTDPNFLADWLPGMVLTGIGIALVFPALTSAAVITLPATRYATGSAINAAGRQLGAVLGVALLVAIIGDPTPAEAPRAFDEGWTFAAAAALCSSAAGLLLSPARVRRELRDEGATRTE